MKTNVRISTDPIADMLSRIRNAIAVNKNEIQMPHSNVKETVAKILAKSGFIANVKVGKDVLGRKQLEIVINGDGTPAQITEISRISKPGRRLYVKANEIPVVKRGRGIVVVSTSQGMMTGDEAKAKRLGGELICKVY
ncbi:30S ribosomal protein S8 [Candidatus Saccharibacteria bacterium]|jgi:small subunit ribosomal protein S8|nr:30S ribosomal protein S8 [Candidatus Saccharibacteria bacterium]